MRPFTFTRVKDVATAVQEVTGQQNAKFIAGGTNLLDLMKIDVMTPQHLVDITHIALKTIEENKEGGLRLGALATNAATAYHALVETRYPLLSHAILAGATGQLRNMATDGGNLLQRTRCYYFYDTDTPCNKREPGSGCSAIKGYNRDLAILGTSEHCIATHPSDMAVALAALDAKVNVTGKDGDRVIPILEFHRLPGDKPHIDTNLKEDEIITSIDLPAKGFADHYTYIKLRDRASYAFALVSVAIGLEMEGNTVKEARIALGGVAHKPWRLPQAEALLQGKEATKANFTKVAEAYLEGAKGYGDNDFKIELARRAMVRALEQALSMEAAS
ncbi:FAD binding domain-containing protein [Pontibacter chinhatensis]|uniref:Xanthine dehydrogenase YagS FAD-binding subunit n=1 Tax=Pontibacter chinhatensis TaxID=1436961 RepID=A0A1I2RQ24_9BACT|nr:xanthine dehydrogenase family protein subunit M [Pontibacter chinhatensis]SFG39866.1 xanthine dehydrogenase YagS FAD-binding subunit [Pontibacter chinhatensis]